MKVTVSCSSEFLRVFTGLGSGFVYHPCPKSKRKLKGLGLGLGFSKKKVKV